MDIVQHTERPGREAKPLTKHFFDALFLHPDFWSLVLAYNAHIIPPWQDRVPDSFLAGLPNRYRPPASTSSFYWDFSEESTRIALLSDSLLHALSRVAGVTLNAKALASCIVRDEQRALRATIGDDLYQYAIQRGQYLVGEAEGIMDRYDQKEPLATRIERHGLRALWFLSRPWPAELCRSFSTRLESKWTERSADSADIAADPLPAGARAILWHFMKKCLLREVAPSWAQYFTF
ncbi:MAG: SctK family type III secretion system sorting platform protein [Desulfovibrionaceae bacterium]|nr:SctK family type III secretion system sorting platform protein [Desulfovibrionaceae bacterium]